VYRLGVVTRTDPATCRVKARFPARDDVESWWLDVIQPKTHRDKAYWMPDVGEHVACHLDEHGEDGVVSGAIYSSADPVPVESQDVRQTTWADGAVEVYDRAGHSYLLDVPAGGEIRLRVGRSELVIADGQATLRTPRFQGEQS